MKKTMLGVILTPLFILNCLAAEIKPDSITQDKQDSLTRIKKSRLTRIDGKVSFLDVATPASEVEGLLYIPKAHPAAADSVPVSVVERVAERKRLLDKDSLSSADLFWVMRPFFEWAQDVDPHLRVEPQPGFASYTRKARKQARNISTPGFLLLNVHDTLIVNRSVDPLFQCGDRILSVNGISASEYLQYCYDDRYIYPFTLLCNYHYELIRAADFKVSLERNGQALEIVTQGIPWSEVYHGLIRQQEFRAQTFPEAKAGYFAIVEFYYNNNLLINKLRKAILQAKKQGCNSFILDLRGNPGGNGSAFDNLLSIFIDKPVIDYVKNQRLKVSERTRHDYDFLCDSMLGQLVEMPDNQINKEVSLDPKKHIPMQYYVLMDKDTGSTASTFCNILQYNDVALLVGEPMRHNALNYGEVLDGYMWLTSLYWSSLSTMEINENTKAVEGVVMPDIAIPYVAADYLSGQDAVLNKLIAIIRQQTDK